MSILTVSRDPNRKVLRPGCTVRCFSGAVYKDCQPDQSEKTGFVKGSLLHYPSLTSWSGIETTTGERKMFQASRVKDIDPDGV